MDNFLEIAKNFIDIDERKSRKEILENIKKNKEAISKIFNYLTEEEKKEYLRYTNIDIIINYLKQFTINEKIIIVKNIYMNLDDLYDLYRIIIDVDDNQKEIYLYNFSKCLPEHYIYAIIENFSNDITKIKLAEIYLKENCYIFGIIYNLDDMNKEKYIDKFNNISDQIELILSLKDSNKIKKYITIDKYKKYRAILVAHTNDNKLIKNEFDNNINIKFRTKLIEEIKDENLKIQLIDKLNDLNIKMFYQSNIDDCKKLLSKLKGTPLDKNITFGVELECSNKKINKYKVISKIFGDYIIKKDNSVKNGFEIVSGILKYNVSDLNKLKNVCYLLDKCNFYTDHTAGGHIHIGAQYLNRAEDYIMLLYLYLNTEDILYFISDRKNSNKRKEIKSYAKKNKLDYIEAIDEGLFTMKYNNIKELFTKICTSRYRGLNLSNIDTIDKNTIEFRMPNGEINFDELLLNVKLFGRLIEMSHKLNDLDDNNIIKKTALMIGNTKKEKDRLELLLNILFDNEEERKLYRERYFSNKILYLKNINNLIKEIKDSFQNEQLVNINNKNILIRTKK